MAKARNFQDRQLLRSELLSLHEEVPSAKAVAHRPGAHAERVERVSKERVERDDLVDLAAPDVHVIRERVRELGRDRSDLPSDSAEIVEQACTLARKLGK